MLSDNIYLHSTELLPGPMKRQISSKEAPSTLTIHEENITSCNFLSTTTHSLNRDITFQIRKFYANHFLNSGCKFFPLFMPKLMTDIWGSIFHWQPEFQNHYLILTLTIHIMVCSHLYLISGWHCHRLAFACIYFFEDGVTFFFKQWN